MKRIQNSGCVSQSTYNALRARDKAKRDAQNTFFVYCVKKNGDLYKKPFADMGFRTRAEAETKKAYWEEINPGTKFAIVER